MMRLVLALLAFLLTAPAYAQLGGGLMFPGPGTPHSAGGGGGVTWAFKTSATGGGGSSVTLSAMAIGTTVSSDIVVVVVSNDGGAGAVPTGVTVGGNAAALVTGASDTSGVDDLTMWWVSGVTLGATSNVVVTSSGTMTTVGAMVGVISGSATPTPTTGTAVAASFTDPFVISRTVPSGGIGIAVLGQNGSLAGSWSNATQDTTFNRGSGTQDSLAHTALGTGATISPTYTGLGGNQVHGIMGVWGP